MKPVGVSWKLTSGEWNSGDRAVDLVVNVSLASVLPEPARSSASSSGVNVSIAIPDADHVPVH